MLVVTDIEVMGFRKAIFGMRNAMNSWDRADSYYKENGEFVLGPNDKKLLLNLSVAGSSHRKALRMIHVQMDVLAPLYWWKDYDTYKVATVANSCSTMHKIHSRDLTLDDFSYEALDEECITILEDNIKAINKARRRFLDSGMQNTMEWKKMIQMLGSNYNQKRTIDINYETALAIIHDRRNHKLVEFRDFVQCLLNELPYMNEIVEAVNNK